MMGLVGALLLGLGLCLVIEGAALIALPRRLEDLLELLARIPAETRQRIGLGMVAAGVALIWLVGPGAGFTLD
jgi:uncharacterized protein YjeT (DUF2065 family)